jgi:hypothetical protein
MTDKEEYKKTLDLYLQTCQEEYRSAHPNCITCALCKDRQYKCFAECKVTGKRVGDYNLIRVIRANMCDYYTPYIN